MLTLTRTPHRHRRTRPRATRQVRKPHVSEEKGKGRKRRVRERYYVSLLPARMNKVQGQGSRPTRTGKIRRLKRATASTVNVNVNVKRECDEYDEYENRECATQRGTTERCRDTGKCQDAMGGTGTGTCTGKSGRRMERMEMMEGNPARGAWLHGWYASVQACVTVRWRSSTLTD